MKHSSLFDYLVSKVNEKYNLAEAKIDVEYERNFSSIPRDIFDAIILMDPKTNVVGDEIKNIGFGSKQLLLPKYLAGEVDFIENQEAVESALTAYYENIANYPKFNEFKTVADFIAFMQNPETASSAESAKQSPMDKTYSKYYSDIDREIFDKIIAMDPDTTDTKIGIVAKNFLLIAYRQGEHNFIDLADDVKDAIERFYEIGDSYSDGKSNIQNFTSVEEFINYKVTSPTSAAVADQGIVEGRDFEIVASSSEYDIIKALTWEGSRAIGHARGAQNQWCTIGGRDGHTWIGSDGIGTYYKEYQPNGPKHSQVYMIISKNQPTLTAYNYNLAINVNDGSVYECRDGLNINGAGGFNEVGAALLMRVLIGNPDLVKAINRSGETLLKNCPTVRSAADLVAAINGPLVITSQAELAKLFTDKAYLTGLRAGVRELQISNVAKIPYGIFANFSGLQSVELGAGVQKIGAQAFKACANLKTIKLSEDLQYIGPEAFAGCTKLRGSVRVPDSLVEIGERAFELTHCHLKVDRARTKRLRVNPNDKDWAKTHIESIKL